MNVEVKGLTDLKSNFSARARDEWIDAINPKMQVERAVSKTIFLSLPFGPHTFNDISQP